MLANLGELGRVIILVHLGQITLKSPTMEWRVFLHRQCICRDMIRFENQQLLDRRMGIAAAILIGAIEGRQN